MDSTLTLRWGYLDLSVHRMRGGVVETSEVMDQNPGQKIRMKKRIDGDAVMVS